MDQIEPMIYSTDFGLPIGTSFMNLYKIVETYMNRLHLSDLNEFKKSINQIILIPKSLNAKNAIK